MSHLSNLASLAERLADSLTGLPPSSPSLRRARAIAKAGILNHSFLRTNHFEINNVLAGLIEKFDVRQRPDLADALRSRLAELQTVSNSWIPEILALLLALSSDPVNCGKSKISKKKDVRLEEPKWSDLMEDLPDEPEVWNNVISGDSCSDDDGIQFTDSGPETSSQPSGNDDDILSAKDAAAACVYQPDMKVLQDILLHPSCAPKDLQQATRNYYLVSPPEVSELQVCREIILMARGFTTPIFQLDGISPSTFHLSHPLHLYQTSLTATTSLLREAAHLCSIVHNVRIWSQKSHTVPFLRTFAQEIFLLLQSLSNQLDQLEASLLSPTGSVVSIIELVELIRSETEALAAVANVITVSEQGDVVFDYLDNLFEEVSQAQLTGRATLFTKLVPSFLACLHVYLRPTVRWITTGEMDSQDSTFFIKKKSSKSADLSKLWYSSYEIRQSFRNRPLAPKFVRTSLLPILNGGKTVIFLKELGVTDAISNLDSEDNIDKELTIDSIVTFPNPDGGSSSTSSATVPFSEQVKTSLSRWFCRMTQTGQHALFRQLWTRLHLSTYFNILSNLFLAQDGFGFFNFSRQLHEYVSSKSEADPKAASRNESGSGLDAFVITQIAQNVFETSPDVESESVQVVQAISGLKFGYFTDLEEIVVAYKLPWYIKNIVTESSIQILQRVLNLLLCVDRVKFLLNQNVFSIRARPGYHQKCPQCIRSLPLHQKVLWFVSSLHLYLMADVINPLVATTNTSVQSCSDLDKLFDLYAGFTNKLEVQCLLADTFAPILDRVFGILLVGIETSQLIDGHFGMDETATEGYGEVKDDFERLEEQFDEEIGSLRLELESVGRITGDASWSAFLSRLSP